MRTCGIAESFRLETDSELIRRVAKTALSMSRKEKQELKNVLEQLESRLSQADSPECTLALKAIERILEIEHVDEEVAKQAVDSLLKCHTLTKAILLLKQERMRLDQYENMGLDPYLELTES